MRKIATAMLVLALGLTATASAATPGTTGKNGGTYGPGPGRHHIGVSHNRPAGRYHIGISPNRPVTLMATTSRALGVSLGRRVASAGLASRYGGYWRNAFFKQLKFKTRRPGGRLRFEFFWFTRCCITEGYITVWKNPNPGGRFAYYYAITH